MKAGPRSPAHACQPGSSAPAQPATADARQLQDVFYDETAEHLTDLEGALLALDTQAPDPAGLELMYRAARSAKAGSITLGLVDVAELADQLQHLLDRLRRQQLVVDPAVRDAGVEASSVLRALLAAHRGTGTVGTARTERAQRRLEVFIARGGIQAASPGAERKRRSDGSDAMPAGWRGQSRRAYRTGVAWPSPDSRNAGEESPGKTRNGKRRRP